MVSPRSAQSSSECLAIAEALAGDYPLCLGWQAGLEPLLPPLPAEVTIEGATLRRCMAFCVDEELGPHFVYESDDLGLAEVLLSEIPFTEPLTPEARLWLRAFRDWRDGRTHRRRKPLRILS